MKGEVMSRKILVLMGWLSLALCFASGSTAWAMIPKTPTGDLCLNCHESGTPTPGDPANWTLRSEYQGEAGCITCHSHATSSTTYVINPGGSPEITVPVTVYTGATEPTEFLASGNFWWVKGPADGIPGSPNNWTGGGNDQGGHNIFPGEVDERYTLEGVSVAPGHSSGCLNPDSCHSNLNTADNTFGNRQSCLKCHMMMKGTDYPAGFHHADDSALVVGLGRNVPGDPGFDGYYRYLTGHMSGEGHGVAGIEDDDWEATVSSTDHNEYLGLQGALNSPGGFRKGVDHHTSTAFCSGCHGNFHVASEYATGKPEGGQDYEWLRHPVEMVLPDDEGSDYHLYTEYNPNVPLGRPDLSSFTGPSDIVTPGTDVINCLSCHRSHGTPGGSHLRWDPTQWNACATCHLTKRSSIEGQYICDAIDDCNDCHTSHGRSLRFQYEESPGVFRAEDEFGGDHDNKALVWMKMDFYGPVEHTADEVLFPIPGDSPYVLGVEPYNGICEVCHTGTLYWKNDGTGDPHYGGPGAEEQCNACHLHVNEWLGDMPDDAAHNVHHGAFARGPDEVDCSVCHGKGDTIGEMVAAGACDPCHSPGGAFDGVNDPVIGAKNNWPDAVYEADGTALKSGKQGWCAGCHDDGSSIIGGVAAPNVMGDNLSYGFNISGHGRPSAGKNCGDCHDFTRLHVDSQARTYVAASDNYRNGYRLNEDMAVPRNGEIDPQAFRLCTNCHAYLAITGPTSNFRDDQKSQQYHEMHLNWWPDRLASDSDFDGTGIDSALTCVNCHNVHGSPAAAMIRHGELISSPGTTDKVPALDFKWFEADGVTQTWDLSESRYGRAFVGMPGGMENYVCTGCHTGPEGLYFRIPVTATQSIIDKIRGTKEPGKIIRIIGSGFGEPQGDSEVHIGPKVYGPGHRKIKLWTDTKIKVKLPNYKCEWFKGNDYRRRKIWVVVGGEDGVSSNVKSIKVFKPDTCP